MKSNLSGKSRVLPIFFFLSETCEKCCFWELLWSCGSVPVWAACEGNAAIRCDSSGSGDSDVEGGLRERVGHWEIDAAALEASSSVHFCHPWILCEFLMSVPE